MVNRILRWFLFGGIIFFLAKTLKDHWHEVRTLEITGATLALLTVALGITLIAHIWSGWVWHLILKVIGQPRDGRWTTMIYLKTNIAKYLPGNVWHFFGRVRSLQATGASTGAAIVGVVLEPLLMAAAALGLAAISFSVALSDDWRLLALSFGALVAMLVAIHPRFLNPILQRLGKAKARSQGLTVITSTLRFNAYPWRSLIGELGFVALRGLGFVMTIIALDALKPSQFFPVLGAFSIAWLMGLVVPGAPGGVGVFEAVAIAILGNQLPSGLLISSVALYRLISTLAEALGAGLIWFEERIAKTMAPVANFKRRLLLLPSTEEEALLNDQPPSEVLVPESVSPVPEQTSELSAAELPVPAPEPAAELPAADDEPAAAELPAPDDEEHSPDEPAAAELPAPEYVPVEPSPADLAEPERSPVEVSYVIAAKESSVSETGIAAENNIADSGEPANGLYGMESAVSLELDHGGPVLPSFLPNPVKADGRSTS